MGIVTLEIPTYHSNTFYTLTTTRLDSMWDSFCGGCETMPSFILLQGMDLPYSFQLNTSIPSKQSFGRAVRLPAFCPNFTECPKAATSRRKRLRTFSLFFMWKSNLSFGGGPVHYSWRTPVISLPFELLPLTKGGHCAMSWWITPLTTYSCSSIQSWEWFWNRTCAENSEHQPSLLRLLRLKVNFGALGKRLLLQERRKKGSRFCSPAGGISCDQWKKSKPAAISLGLWLLTDFLPGVNIMFNM